MDDAITIIAILAILVICILLNRSAKLRRAVEQQKEKERKKQMDRPGPFKIDVWPKDDHNTVDFAVRGVKHYNPKEGFYEALFIAELHNEHDPHAIGVWAPDGSQVGHLPRGNDALWRMMRRDEQRVLCGWVNVYHDDIRPLATAKIPKSYFADIDEDDVERGFW